MDVKEGDKSRKNLILNIVLVAVILLLIILLVYIRHRDVITSEKVVCMDNTIWDDYAKIAKTGDLFLTSPAKNNKITILLSHQFTHMGMVVVLPHDTNRETTIDDLAVLHIIRATEHPYNVTPFRVWMNCVFYNEYRVIPIRKSIEMNDLIRVMNDNYYNIGLSTAFRVLWGFFDKMILWNKLPDIDPENYHCVSFINHMIESIHQEEPDKIIQQPNRWCGKDIIDRRYKEHLYDHDNHIVLCNTYNTDGLSDTQDPSDEEMINETCQRFIDIFGRVVYKKF